MKRTMSSALMLILLSASVLSACSKNENSPQASSSESASASSTAAPSGSASDSDGKPTFENTTLNVAAFDGGFGTAYWEEVVKKFEADYPGVKINLETKKGDVFRDYIKTQFLSGNAPDFIATPFVETFAADGQLLELNDVFDGEALDKSGPLKDKVLDGFLDASMPLGDGKILYAPTGFNVQGLWYNKTLFDAKGWAKPKTWDEFFAMSDSAKEVGASLYTYQGAYPSYNEMILWPMIASHAGTDALKKIFNYEEGAWADPKVKEVLDIFYRIAQKDDLMKGTVALNHTQAQTEFLNGKALFIPNGTWFENEMKDAIPAEGFSFGFMAPPTFAGDPSYAVASNGYYLIPKNGKNPELAKAFLKYQFNEDNIILNVQKTGELAAVKGVVELSKSYVSPAMYEALGVFDQGAKPVMTTWKVTPPLSVNVSEAIFNPLTSVMNKKMTVDEWSASIEKSMATVRKEIEAAAK
ncbi:carbohydrate ABC transporter substrate-binding protein [Cohnella rhizosphaerae]|uniref:Carbohydrate ABC transporter substrate-binding protein n=1 Tax=Cohnella rhizosphaerae TaxID=1457232 RepID=A0A9X4KX36_9BACL|nr:carbohydrate ABC transporter substrate-binding protein [Cohnella rhizosphaerae]MDG0809814.1 carbohydrate ABC transporter substrate-binding protein [Cohnella rhizosphaerae]